MPNAKNVGTSKFWFQENINLFIRKIESQRIEICTHNDTKSLSLKSGYSYYAFLFSLKQIHTQTLKYVLHIVMCLYSHLRQGMHVYFFFLFLSFQLRVTFLNNNFCAKCVNSMSHSYKIRSRWFEKHRNFLCQALRVK